MLSQQKLTAADSVLKDSIGKMVRSKVTLHTLGVSPQPRTLLKAAMLKRGEEWEGVGRWGEGRGGKGQWLGSVFSDWLQIWRARDKPMWLSEFCFPCPAQGVVDAIGTAASTALQGPIQVTYTEAFKNTVLPAFERSCQVMFQQINTAFQAGTQQCKSAPLLTLRLNEDERAGVPLV